MARNVFNTIPNHITDVWEKQIAGYQDAAKKLKPVSYDKDYLAGYDAKQRGWTLRQEVLQWMFNR